MKQERHEDGFALATALMLMALLMALLSAYSLVTRVERSTTKSTMDQARSFYAAEAGLNIRAEEIRQTFVGYNVPAGTSPPPGSPGTLACQGDDPGTADFECRTHSLQERDVLTHVEETAGNPSNITIPRGEQFQNLVAIEYRYDVNSAALNRSSLPEALLEMNFRSRLVPMFQFAAFYNKDLEILPGPNMTLAGPVHTNGDLYLDSSGNTLTINGQTSTAGSLYHGRKNANSCQGTARIYDPANPLNLPACAGRVEVTNEAPWNGMVRTGAETVTVPAPEAFDPTPGATYWDKADLRIVLDLTAGGAVQIRNQDGTTDAARTADLNSCLNGGFNVARRTNTFYNNREGTLIQMLDVDARGLLDCIQIENIQEGGRGINDTTEGGLVWYLSVDGPSSGGQNNYGVRVRNGSQLASSVAGAPAIRGLTVVTDQAVYIQGDYNNVAKKPAAFLGDSLNILSNVWNDANSQLTLDPAANPNRNATSTAINAAFLAGTDVTGGAEGSAGQDSGAYNGGLENFPRFHENWQGHTLTYRGSFVSLFEPQHVDGGWIHGTPQYFAPLRDWGFDTDFRDAANLPPLSPRFVYLRQDLFVRNFEL